LSNKIQPILADFSYLITPLLYQILDQKTNKKTGKNHLFARPLYVSFSVKFPSKKQNGPIP